MARSSGPKRKKGGMALAPAVPLAIALAHGALTKPGKLIENPTPEQLITSPVECEEPIEGFEACHSQYPAGCSLKGTYDPFLNRLKNKLLLTGTHPEKFLTSTVDFNALEKEIPSDLGKTNHDEAKDTLAKAGEGKLHGVIGYLYDAKAEDAESSNCELSRDKEEQDVDFHIWVGFDDKAAAQLRDGKAATPDEKKTAAIVEMTPHTRAHHQGWTTDALKKERGKKVRAVGQLMVDNEHNVSSQNCGRTDHTDKCWRLSVWELHPVTSFQVCSEDPSNYDKCTETSNNWAELGTGAQSASNSETPGKAQKKNPI